MIREALPALETRNLGTRYREKQAIQDVSMTIPSKQITAIIGPSGCGKSTLLRCFNRMNDLIPGAIVTGDALLHGESIYRGDIDVTELRRRVGMVFQKPNPFPKSILANVAFGPKVNGFQGDLDVLVEQALHRAALWDEVNDRLEQNALELSGGQQQRLCIARALAVEPEVVLMDEPTSGLDPAATAKIETLIRELAEHYTVVIVTHNMQQAARVSDLTAFLYVGELIEYGSTAGIFENPENRLTEKYITGEFG